MITFLLAFAIEAASWKPVLISFYTMGQITSDGTPMDVNGRWVATRAFPLGTVLEIRYRNTVQVLTVRDRTARRFGHRADLPKGTWLRFGQPASRGLLQGQWRIVPVQDFQTIEVKK